MLKRSKAIGCDGLNGNIITDVFSSIKVILFKLFKASLEEAVFPEKLKSQKLFESLKKVIKKMLKTTDQFLFFQFFSKVLERIMYNRLYKCFIDNSLLHENQLGFQINSSTEHAMLQFTHDFTQNFDNGKFTLQSWTKGWRQIDKIKQNRFFYGMFYSKFFAIFYQEASKFGFWLDGWVLAIKFKYFRDFLEIS